MTALARVIGLGQDAGGDDAVGLVIVREVAARAPALETLLARDAADLIDLLATPRPIVIVDGVVDAGASGRVVRLDPSALDDGPAPVSSHAMSVAQALELARALSADRMTPSIRIVGVTIERPAHLGGGLSPAVRAAVQPATELVLELARG